VVVHERFCQWLQKTKHFCGRRQEKVAKSVPYALPRYDEGRWINSSGLSFLPGGVHTCMDTQTAGNQGSVPAIEISINLNGIAEIAKPQK